MIIKKAIQKRQFPDSVLKKAISGPMRHATHHNALLVFYWFAFLRKHKTGHLRCLYSITRHLCAMSSVPSQTRARSWCFTLNNPTEEEILLPQSWDDSSYNYLVYQLELGESGTPHLQGYVSFKNPVRFAEFRKYFVDQRAHIAAAKGTAEQNKKYCTKEEGRLQGPWEYGEVPQPGKRNDLLAVKELLDLGATLTEVSDSFFSQFVRYSRAFKEYQLLHSPRRNWSMEVIVIWGPTGTGKTRWCYENHPDAYWKSKSCGAAQFWDGYEGQSVIVVDEYYGWFSWDYLLRFTDRYPFSLDIKHGTVNCAARTIVFTSNKHPKDWYPNSKYGWDDSNPFKRRITEIRELAGESLPSPSPPPPSVVQVVPSTPEWEEEVRLNNLYLGNTIDLT